MQATAFIAAACRTGLDPLAHLFATSLTAAQKAMVTSGRGEVVSRTQIIDSMLLNLHTGKTIVNLGAGLCTRPYRLDLSACRSLIEIDAPEILQYKEQTLRGYAVSCPVSRIPGDTTTLPPLPADAIVITEGLLVYLSPTALATLALTLPGTDWLADIVSAPSASAMSSRTPIPLWGLDSLAVFEDTGWTVHDYRPLPVPRAPSPTTHTVIDGVLHLTR